MEVKDRPLNEIITLAEFGDALMKIAMEKGLVNKKRERKPRTTKPKVGSPLFEGSEGRGTGPQ